MLRKIAKKMVFALIIIYGFDLIFSGINIIVPMNYITIPLIAILGFPGLVTLALTFFFFI